MKTLLIFSQVVLLTMCSGCVSVERSYPDRHYFVLEVRADGDPVSPTTDETLQVSNIRVSPRYDDKSFVYRTSNASYESDFYNQFLISPASLITEEVRKGLTLAGVFRYVTGPSSDMQPTYVLMGTVNALYGDFRNTSAAMAVIEIEFFLTRELAKPGIVMQKRYSKSQPLTGRSPEALVNGWDEALGAILTSLITDLKAAASKDSR